MKLANICAVIPARIESSRVEQKVFQKISYYGKEISLIEIKILELLKLFPKENIIVSAGEEPLKEVAERYGIGYSERGVEYFKRGYTVTTEDSVREVIKDVKTPYVAWCPPVVPFHSADVIKSAIEFFIQQGDSSSLTTAVSMKSYFWWKGRPLNYFADKRHVQSQLLDPLHRIANGLYLGKTKELRKAGYFLVEPIKIFEVNEIQAIDIDTVEDLYLAKIVAKSIYEI
jgi:CMP-N-acetylneuraminic acid synthetase